VAPRSAPDHGLGETIGAWSDADEGLTCAYMTPATGAPPRSWPTGCATPAWTRTSTRSATWSAATPRRPGAKTLITGSHYDTVRNGGKYDGRLGILLPIAIVRHLHARGERLPFHLEVVGFAEEEGVRFKSTFLGSMRDHRPVRHGAAGRARRRRRQRCARRSSQAGHDPGAIPAIAREPEDLLGFVEVHIEQGRCCWNAACRWAWSRRLPAARATWSS
jgi:N-carbamoyl-L-amino-acid hydrolase